MRFSKRIFLQSLSIFIFLALIATLFHIEPTAPLISLNAGLSCIQNANRTVLVVEWNSYYGISRENDAKLCPVPCLITSDRRYAEFADSVVFHAMQLRVNTSDIPSERSHVQRYVFHLMESPHSFSMFKLFDTLPANFFNWTMTYRRDSDVYRPYGTFDSLAVHIKKWYNESKLLTKTKSAIWISSHCSTPSRREIVVKELQKLTQVDTIGKCGSGVCGSRQDWKGCNSRINDDYLFYFAFENSCAIDYATEKFWGRLHLNVIPVVLYRKPLEGLVPAHAFLSLDDYPNIADLAKHMDEIKRNKTKILTFIQWKQSWWKEAELKKKEHVGYCGLCEQLYHDRNSLPRFKSYDNKDLERWFISGGCQNNNSVDNMIQTL